MARTRKNRNAKNATPAVTPEAFATAVSESIVEALEPISQKLDNIINSQQEAVKLDDDTLDLMGVDSAEELGEILEEATDVAADALEDSGNPIAAAIVDAGVDTAEVVSELVKSRKSRKSNGEATESITVEEVVEVIEAVAEEIADNLSDDEVEQLVDDGLIDEGALDDPNDGQEDGGTKRRRKAISNTRSRSRKSAKATGYQTKRASTPPIQRKYNNIFVGGRDASAQRGQKDLPPVVRFARAVKCSDYFARGGASGGFADPERAAWAAVRYYKDNSLAREFKSMSATQPSSSGVLVPQDYLDDIIEMLYDNTVLFELGAQKVPMPHGNLSIARQTSGARAHFGGEARPISASKPTHGLLHLSSKRLQAIVVMTEELLRSTDISSDTIFGNDLLMQMKLGIEHGGLLGKGTQFEPLGLFANPEVEAVNLLTIGDTQLADAQGRPTADLPIFVKGKVLAKNVIGTSYGWTFNSEAEQFFKRMKSTDGKFIWKDEMDNGTFNGDPYRTTNMIPTAFDGTTSLVFGNWNDFLVGEQFGLETRTSYDATVRTDNGDINTFQEVMTATRATTYIDMGNRHDESFIKVKNVKVRG